MAETGLRQSEAAPGSAGEQTPNVAKKRKVVFFSCRIGTDIDLARKSFLRQHCSKRH